LVVGFISFPSIKEKKGQREINPSTPLDRTILLRLRSKKWRKLGVGYCDP
jgi:hypothetical protein